MTTGDSRRFFPRVRIFLVDDQEVVLRGLQLLISRQPGLEVCGTARGESEALERIARLDPDLAIVDLHLEPGNGCRLIRMLRGHCPRIKILVFSMHSEIAVVQAALAAGAQAYVCKDLGTERLLKDIHLVMHGVEALHRLPPHPETVLDCSSGLPRLGRRP